MKFRAVTDGFSLEVTQELVLDRGTVVQVEVTGQKPSDVEEAVSLLKQEYGNPIGRVVMLSETTAICFWRRPMLSWQTEFHDQIPAEKLTSILSRHGLSSAETAALTGVLLVLQLFKCEAKSASYVVHQLADVSPERQGAILNAAFEIRHLADPIP